MIRQHVHFRGRVQGVGFRFTAQSVAGGFDVTGFVKNLPSGEVELVAEGAPREVAAYLAALRDAMAGHITGEDVRELPATGEYADFAVRYA